MNTLKTMLVTGCLVLASAAAHAQAWGPGPPQPPDPYRSYGGMPPAVYYYTSPYANSGNIPPQQDYQPQNLFPQQRLNVPCIPRNLITGEGCN